MKHTSWRRMRGSFLLGPSFFLGMLAAIAVPAYHDYTIRAKVVEGLNLAGAVKAGVAEYYMAHNKWPRDLRELQFDAAPRGKYVMFVALNHGTVVIRYSRNAGPQLERQQLTLRPTVSPQGDILWACGYTPDRGDDPATGAAAAAATDVAARYLPSSCRGRSDPS